MLDKLDESGFWHYSGSLTQPPCTEAVEWIVFRKPLEIEAGGFKFLKAKSQVGSTFGGC